jgi:hypothetical protein
MIKITNILPQQAPFSKAKTGTLAALAPKMPNNSR